MDRLVREGRRAGRVFFPLATTALFSGSYVAGEYTTRDLDPLIATFLRYLVALLFLLVLLPGSRLGTLKLSFRDALSMLALGLTGIVGYHFLFFLSLRYTAVANTAIINALSPVLTAAAASVLLGERLSRRNYLGIALALVAVALLVTEGDLAGIAARGFNRGDVAMLLAVLCFVAYSLLTKRLLARHSSLVLTFYATLSGVAILLFVVPLADLTAQMEGMSAASLYAVVYMGVFASGLGYLTYAFSIKTIGPTRTAAFVYSLLPVLVAALAFTFFGERPGAMVLLSAVVILIALHEVLTADSSTKG
jgi:drug/metabolite transporter (DMT)-like permease